MSNIRDENQRTARLSDDVARDLQQQPHVLLRLAENSLTVADSLRNNYFRNTASFVADLRKAVRASEAGRRTSSPLETFPAGSLTWADVRDEVELLLDALDQPRR
ncbi:hypothetical protein BH23CHL2_BH23CHL2_31800 [soil metagenome]